MRNIHGLLLAAGKSARLGMPKQLISYQGKTLVRHIAEVALEAQINNLTIVTGAEQDKVRDVLGGLSIEFCHNPDWASGMGSSIATGARFILSRYPKASGIMVLLSDQPHVNAEHLLNLQKVFENNKQYLAVSGYSDTFGVPAIVGHDFFEEVCSLQGDHGAKHIFINKIKPNMSVTFAAGAIDIDTPDDLKKIDRN